MLKTTGSIEYYYRQKRISIKPRRTYPSVIPNEVEGSPPRHVVPNKVRDVSLTLGTAQPMKI
jgi:hypothetical protein